MQEDLHRSSKRFEQNKQKLKDSKHVSPENKEAIQRFINKSFAEGISKARARKYLTDFHSMLQLVDDFTLSEASKEDLERLVAEIEQADYAEATKSDFKCVVKKFYKVMEGDWQKRRRLYLLFPLVWEMAFHPDSGANSEETIRKKDKRNSRSHLAYSIYSVT